MTCNRIFFLLPAILLIQSCTGIYPTSFADLSSAHRQVIEQYSNENILLNIIRSSKNSPMSFLDIPSVIGTGSVSSEAKLSGNVNSLNPSSTAGFFSATTGSNYGGAMGLTVNNGFTFTQASLDNAEFMKSFLKEIPLDVVGFKGTERLLPRAVSYTLLIESIELQVNGNVQQRFQNDPLNPEYQRFQDLLYLLIESGLTVEVVSKKVPISPAMDPVIFKKSFNGFGTAIDAGLVNGSVVIDTIQTKEGLAYQLFRVIKEPKLCLNKFRTQEILGQLLSPNAYCNDSPKYSRKGQDFSKTLAYLSEILPQQKNMEIVISLRSPGNVFNFLGSVIKVQLDSDNAKIINIQPSGSVFDPYNSKYYSPQPLFKIFKNAKLDHPSATVVYRGDTYQIDGNDNSYTNAVMEFVSTLVTIAKIPGSIPASPSVLVR